MRWESFVHRLPDGTSCEGHRSRVPGGWIVMLPAPLGGGTFFHADETHAWSFSPEALAKSARASSPPAKKGTKSSRPRATTTALTWQPFLHALPQATPYEGYRSPVPGGWFVMLTVRPGGGVFFYRDPQHEWGADEAKALVTGATLAGSGRFSRAKTLVEWSPIRHTTDTRNMAEAYRARVPNGWFVLFPIEAGGGAFFYDDPAGAWSVVKRG
jgi:hypothetical protein